MNKIYTLYPKVYEINTSDFERELDALLDLLFDDDVLNLDYQPLV